MKAWLMDGFSGADKMRLAEIADPIPAHGEVLLRVNYAALNPADRYLAQGEYPAKPPLPHILGRDGSGTIVSSGPGVEGHPEGQKRAILRGDLGVTRWGTFAELVASPAESLIEIPDGWSDAQAGSDPSASMTIFSSGISMYAMGKLFNLLLGWSFDVSVLVSAAIVLAYVPLGGLTSAIYNEVLQFFLIVFGFAPLVALGLHAVGGWDGLSARLAEVAVTHGLPVGAYTHAWRGMAMPSHNPIGVEWFGLVMGLGFVLSFGYWCTDFLVVQRAMAADSMTAARRTPLIAAFPKMLFPFLVILPGMIALVLGGGARRPGGRTDPGQARGERRAAARRAGRTVLDYDLATPMMLVQLFPAGMLGLGLTALLASFMSGMAGNVTAFNTVWTYDIYQSHIRPGATDEHYLWMGRVATVGGILLVDRGGVRRRRLQQHHGPAAARLRVRQRAAVRHLRARHVLEPHHGTWRLLRPARRARAARRCTTGSHSPSACHAGVKGGYFAILHTYPSELAQTFWTAITRGSPASLSPSSSAWRRVHALPRSFTAWCTRSPRGRATARCPSGRVRGYSPWWCSRSRWRSISSSIRGVHSAARWDSTPGFRSAGSLRCSACSSPGMAFSRLGTPGSTRAPSR